jgi:hypothetical protein
MRTSLATSVAASSLMIALSGSAYAQFGPGPHWVDSVPPATVPLPYALVEFGLDTDLNGSADLDTKFVGPTIVQLSGAQDVSTRYPTLRDPDGHLDVVDTEVVSMIMPGQGASSGWTLLAGISAGLPTHTYGAMAEQPGNSAVAESFFDVFIEIEGTPYGTLHNTTPVHISGLTYQLPPVSDYLVTNYPVPLYNSSQQLIATLTTLQNGQPAHKFIPEPGSLTLAGVATAMGLLRRRRN